MVKALVFFRVIRRLQRREQAVQLHGDERGVDHLALRRAGMDGLAADLDLRAGRVEVLIFQLAECAAVDGIGVIRAEALHIKPVGPASDLLVGRKGQPDGSMRLFGCKQQLCGGQDLRHARLVVRAEQRRAVCDDQALADRVFQLRVFLRRKHDVLLFVQDNIAAVVRLCDACADVLAGRVGRGVHVGDEAIDGDFFVTVRRHGAVDVAVLVNACVCNAHVLHLADKLLCKRKLPRGGRARLGRFVRGRGIGNELQKAFNDCHVCVLLCVSIGKCFRRQTRARWSRAGHTAYRAAAGSAPRPSGRSGRAPQ